MKNIGIAVLVLAVVLGGLIYRDKRKKAEHAAEYEATLRVAGEARRKIAASHRAASMAKLDAVKAAIAHAQSEPPVTVAVPVAAPPSPEPVLARTGYTDKGNLVIAGIARPDAIKIALVPPFRHGAENYLGTVSDNYDNNPPDAVEKKFEQLERLEYVLLVRITEASAPSADVGGRFVGGRASGDAALYSLASGKRLGAFPFAVLQPDQASVSKNGDANAQLLDMFAVTVASSVERELTSFLAGKAGAAAPGVADAADLARFARKIEMELGLPYVAASVKKVTVEHGDGGRPLVTIYAGTPKQLLPGGKISAGVADLVKRVLGVEADIRAEQAK